jgi:inosose dehydratase
MLKAKLGMSPIAWWNDDLPQLSDDVSLEECLRQSRSAGFTGMEQGRRFPPTAAEMLPILKAVDVTLCGGWFSGTLVQDSLEANKDRIQPMIDLFRAVDAPCIVYGEVGRSVQGIRTAPLATKPVLSDDEMAAYARKVTALGEYCADQGMPLVYHHHMGAVVMFEPELDAVIKGAFTVPGDGSLDFRAIVQRLADHGYEGWFVVEAEQDPRANAPLRMAQVGHRELMRVMAAAGYEVVR